MHAVKMQEWLSCFYKIVTELRFEQNCFKSGFWRCCCCRCVAAVVAAVTVVAVAAVAVVGATPKRHSRKSLRVIGKKVFSQIEKVSSISETLWSRIVKTFNFETFEKKRKESLRSMTTTRPEQKKLWQLCILELIPSFILWSEPKLKLGHWPKQ